MLTAVAVSRAKPRGKPYKLGAGNGLYLQVMPNGSRYWRLKYRYGGKEKRLGLGVYPAVSLSDARISAEKARALLRHGVDPSAQRKADTAALRSANADYFGTVATEWLGRQTHMAPSTFEKAKWTLEKLAVPWLGMRPVRDITPEELLAVLRRVECRGKLETAQRLSQRCSQVFRYAIATGRASVDPTFSLRGALASPKTIHRAAITDPRKIGELLLAIDAYSGNFVTLCALRLSALVFLRPGEVRSAEWAEVDLAAAEWRVPKAKTKMRCEHVIPLSAQAISIFRELAPMTSSGRYVFPSLRTPATCMSDGTVTAALRRLGYQGTEMTAHGFRAMASTRLNELGWAPDIIERQLAHQERNRVRAAYNRASHLSERRKMMQAWADYLDRLRAEARARAIERVSA